MNGYRFQKVSADFAKFYSCTLVVTEKAKLIENCLLLNLKGMFASNVMRSMHRKRTVTKASITRICRCATVSLVPLQKPCYGIRF
jgi:hypothetical protein